jgi:hypothetical protein
VQRRMSEKRQSSAIEAVGMDEDYIRLVHVRS